MPDRPLRSRRTPGPKRGLCGPGQCKSRGFAGRQACDISPSGQWLRPSSGAIGVELVERLLESPPSIDQTAVESHRAHLEVLATTCVFDQDAAVVPGGRHRGAVTGLVGLDDLTQNREGFGGTPRLAQRSREALLHGKSQLRVRGGRGEQHPVGRVGGGVVPSAEFELLRGPQRRGPRGFVGRPGGRLKLVEQAPARPRHQTITADEQQDAVISRGFDQLRGRRGARRAAGAGAFCHRQLKVALETLDLRDDPLGHPRCSCRCGVADGLGGNGALLDHGAHHEPRQPRSRDDDARGKQGERVRKQVQSGVADTGLTHRHGPAGYSTVRRGRRHDEAGATRRATKHDRSVTAS